MSTPDVFFVYSFVRDFWDQVCTQRLETILLDHRLMEQGIRIPPVKVGFHPANRDFVGVIPSSVQDTSDFFRRIKRCMLGMGVHGTFRLCVPQICRQS